MEAPRIEYLPPTDANLHCPTGPAAGIKFSAANGSRSPSPIHAAIRCPGSRRPAFGNILAACAVPSRRAAPQFPAAICKLTANRRDYRRSLVPPRIPSRRALVYDAGFGGNFAAIPRGLRRMTVTSRGLYAYLTILTGNRAGMNFPLDARRKTLIGRGTDCHISLPDPLCSRVHATLTCTPDGWVIRDAESRNGTIVNGQKIDEATVVD